MKSSSTSCTTGQSMIFLQWWLEAMIWIGPPIDEPKCYMVVWSLLLGRNRADTLLFVTSPEHRKHACSMQLPPNNKEIKFGWMIDPPQYHVGETHRSSETIRTSYSFSGKPKLIKNELTTWNFQQIICKSVYPFQCLQQRLRTGKKNIRTR